MFFADGIDKTKRDTFLQPDYTHSVLKVDHFDNIKALEKLRDQIRNTTVEMYREKWNINSDF